MEIKKFLLDLFFPWCCLGCNKSGYLICDGCLRKVKINPDISNTYLNSPHLDGVWIVTDWHDEMIKKIIYRFKYHFAKELESSLKTIIDSYLNQLLVSQAVPKIDLIIPIPLSKKRKLYRGFNQSDIIADLVGARLKVRVEKNIIKRRHRRPQVGNDASARRQNIKGVFQIQDATAISNRNVLIVDDIVTTGSTIEEFASLAKRSGAKRAWGLVLAKG